MSAGSDVLDLLSGADGRFADVHTFRNGKVIEIRSFGERQDALDWAGVKA
jgi:hypothetical protein